MLVYSQTRKKTKILLWKKPSNIFSFCIITLFTVEKINELENHLVFNIPCFSGKDVYVISGEYTTVQRGVERKNGGGKRYFLNKTFKKLHHASITCNGFKQVNIKPTAFCRYWKIPLVTTDKQHFSCFNIHFVNMKKFNCLLPKV